MRCKMAKLLPTKDGYLKMTSCKMVEKWKQQQAIPKGCFFHMVYKMCKILEFFSAKQKTLHSKVIRVELPWIGLCKFSFGSWQMPSGMVALRMCGPFHAPFVWLGSKKLMTLSECRKTHMVSLVCVLFIAHRLLFCKEVLFLSFYHVRPVFDRK